MLKKIVRKLLIILMMILLLSYFFPHYDCVVYSNETSEDSLKDTHCSGDYSLEESLPFINIV